MVRVNPSLLLTALPLVAGFGFTVTFAFPGFRTATAAFAVTKILEYSVRCAKGKPGELSHFRVTLLLVTAASTWETTGHDPLVGVELAPSPTTNSNNTRRSKAMAR